jgi:hypothetical protein
LTTNHINAGQSLLLVSLLQLPHLLLMLLLKLLHSIMCILILL